MDQITGAISSQYVDDLYETANMNNQRENSNIHNGNHVYAFAHQNYGYTGFQYNYIGSYSQPCNNFISPSLAPRNINPVFPAYFPQTPQGNQFFQVLKNLYLINSVSQCKRTYIYFTFFFNDTAIKWLSSAGLHTPTAALPGHSSKNRHDAAPPPLRTEKKWQK